MLSQKPVPSRRWISPLKLREQGILGMNRRNVAYIARYNNRRFYPLVDNKLTTKLLAEEVELSVPRLLSTVTTQHEIQRIEKVLGSLEQFVIKPAQGSGGKGILVVRAKQGDQFVKSSGELLGLRDVQRHLTNIISGLHSLGGRNNVAFVEALVEIDDYFVEFSHEGVPDIRLIVFQGFPIMGMLRLATRASDGKANLHQGAIGVGIDIGTGSAVRAVQHDVPIMQHPDTGATLGSIHIPDWPDLLALASRSYDVTELGYLGYDLVIDRHRGPLILELNARPGLSIQLANNAGLLLRLRQIEALPSRLRRRMQSGEKIAYAMQHFSTDQEIS